MLPLTCHVTLTLQFYLLDFPHLIPCDLLLFTHQQCMYLVLYCLYLVNFMKPYPSMYLLFSTVSLKNVPFVATIFRPHCYSLRQFPSNHLINRYQVHMYHYNTFTIYFIYLDVCYC